MSKLSNRLNERFEEDPPGTVVWGWFTEDELQEVTSLESELAQAQADVEALEKAIRNALDKMGDNREVILEQALAAAS